MVDGDLPRRHRIAVCPAIVKIEENVGIVSYSTATYDCGATVKAITGNRSASCLIQFAGLSKAKKGSMCPRMVAAA